MQDKIKQLIATAESMVELLDSMPKTVEHTQALRVVKKKLKALKKQVEESSK